MSYPPPDPYTTSTDPTTNTFTDDQTTTTNDVVSSLLSGGAIAGIAIAVSLVIITLALLCWCCCCRTTHASRRRRERQLLQDQERGADVVTQPGLANPHAAPNPSSTLSARTTRGVGTANAGNEAVEMDPQRRQDALAVDMPGEAPPAYFPRREGPEVVEVVEMGTLQRREVDELDGSIPYSTREPGFGAMPRVGEKV